VNIPSGKQIVTKLTIKDINAKSMLKDLLAKKFNGYITITINEKFGFEDGIIIVSQGFIKGAHYLLLKENKDIFGEDAFRLSLNAFAAKNGTVDVYQITREQVDLMLTFNEKTKIPEIADITKIDSLFPKSYNPEFVARFSDQKQESSKFELLKRIGLGNIRI